MVASVQLCTSIHQPSSTVLMSLFQEISDKSRRFWKRYTLSGTHYSDNHKKLNMLYAMSDPWHMDSPVEQYRFAVTNELILKEFGQVGSILEIGCGEGHQSTHLKQVCDHLTGIDVSARAIKRARKRCPRCEFLIGDVFSQEVVVFAPFDLVFACEVLYYVSNVASTLQRM